MIAVDRIRFAYGQQSTVFESFSWTVDTGQTWAIIGPSGCGKSTLLYLLAGLRRPDSGVITIHGQPVQRPRPRTGLILQDHGLLPWATVWKNARLGLTIREFYGPDGEHAPGGEALSKATANEQVAYWLDRLNISALREKYPSQLSGGQRQRTAIARTLAMEPDLLLMDEPFSSLDALTRENLQNVVVDLQREVELTSVIVTHDIDEAVFLGERILVLSEPPNRQTRIVENDGAGSSNYRKSTAFAARVAQVRDILGASYAPAT
ncbi:MAG: ABC transporter ATP-binding protein [Chloroflexi bacterium]|nr:ABC transporter ATP-binding protein [Chloroflexota bacterium]